MSSSPYRRPPITEAVVELRLADPIGIDEVEKIRDRLTGDYPVPPQLLQNISFTAGPGDQNNRAQVEFAGYRLSSADAINVAIIGPQNVSASRLAPYSGWEEFIAYARRNWAVWRKVAGWREVSRIGVRYINRIDVPNPDERPVPIDDYLVFRPVFPEFEGWQSVESFAINGAMDIANSPFKLILNAGSTPSPLIRTVSFLLDIDISQQGNLPRSDDDLWALIDQIRLHKNRIFEASITDLSRELFSS
ncbi:TIGR04255 family protein [Bradyrhizobium erythrophlei]|uniref:TIGR04255 family protein n=1 Tax=Bradyrhizobium erythrophlei TaxID=1437360 RepID=A0A1M5RHD3_9BRAD|nr:TIGR04255 family protein [Bradyrhizobium erythrophlei]SHH25628.1 TIGR04255 family protein [Bradyrhizobium erythrophlei]